MKDARELIDGWLRQAACEATRAAYEHDITLLLNYAQERDSGVLELASDDIDAWRNAEPAVGPATSNRRLAAASSFYAYAVSLGAAETNPAKPLARKASTAQQEELTRDEADAVLDAAERLGSKASTLVCLLLLDGLRLDLTLQTDAAHVIGARVLYLQTGQHAQRLHPRTGANTRKHLKGRQDGPLLLGDSATSEHSSRLTRFGAHYIIKRTGREAGLEEPVSPATLRRTQRRLSDSD